MKRNRESQCKIKLIQEMHLNKEDQRILEEVVRNAKVTFFQIYRIGVHRELSIKQFVSFIKRYGEACKYPVINTLFWIRSPYAVPTNFYLGKQFENITNRCYGAAPGFCI